MVFKNLFLILFLILNFNIAYTKIIFDKNDILITEIEIQDYIKIHRNYTGEELVSNMAIKNIYLMKNTLKRLLKKSPEYINSLDNIISKEFGAEVLDNNTHINYLRYFKFRNEFIINYFNKNLSEDDIHKIFKDIGSLPLQLSTNKCLTVDIILDLSTNKSFAKVFFENLKNNSKEFKILVENISYNICIDEKKFKYLENKVVDYIEMKTEKNFNEFIYNE